MPEISCLMPPCRAPVACSGFGYCREQNGGDARTTPALIEERQKAAQAGEAWLLWYEDTDRRPEIFTGEGATTAARRRFDAVRLTYNCHLFCRVAVG